MNLKSKADFRRLAGNAASPTDSSAPAASPLKTTLSASDVQHTLGNQVGALDLGLVGNLKARLHQRREDAKMQRALTTSRVEHATALMLEKIAGEVDILRMAFKQDFSDRIASLAESAAASQVMVVRKLKAIEAEARNFVFYDLKRELDELGAMHQQGVIDEDDLKTEAAFRFERYEKLRAEFTQLMDGYQGVVQNAYRGHTG